MMNDEPIKKPHYNTGIPNKHTKYSAELLASIDFCVVTDMKAHIEDLEKRIREEEQSIKPRKTLILTMVNELHASLKALLPYANIKPADSSETRGEGNRMAIQLSFREETEE